MDPLSVTAGIVGILAATVQVSIQLKKLIDGATTANSAVASLVLEVEGFSKVLKLMQETIEDLPTEEPAVGHIGSHWSNIATSIKDGLATIEKLKAVLDKIDKNVTMLDSTRKYIRLQAASGELGIYQQQIRSYKDTMYWSLQAIILWNQLHIRSTTDKLLPNLDEIQDSIQRIAYELTDRIELLHDFVRESSAEVDVPSVQDLSQGLSNLQCCVRSAATVVSSASTILSNEKDTASIVPSSDLADCLPSKPSTPMLRFLASNTVYEYSEAGEAHMRGAPGMPDFVAELSQASDDSPYDSDEDIDLEMIRTLLQIGVEKLHAGDPVEAERRFHRALARSAENEGPAYGVLRLETMVCLEQAYELQDNWQALERILIEKISWLGKRSVVDTKAILQANLDLSKALLRKEDHKQALLYCRRALKGFRKLGSPAQDCYHSSVRLMIEIHHADGNDLEEEAWRSILKRQGADPSVNPSTTSASMSNSASSLTLQVALQEPVMASLAHKTSNDAVSNSASNLALQVALQDPVMASLVYRTSNYDAGRVISDSSIANNEPAQSVFSLLHPSAPIATSLAISKQDGSFLETTRKEAMEDVSPLTDYQVSSEILDDTNVDLQSHSIAMDDAAVQKLEQESGHSKYSAPLDSDKARPDAPVPWSDSSLYTKESAPGFNSFRHVRNQSISTRERSQKKSHLLTDAVYNPEIGMFTRRVTDEATAPTSLGSQLVKPQVEELESEPRAGFSATIKAEIASHTTDSNTPDGDEITVVGTSSNSQSDLVNSSSHTPPLPLVDDATNSRSQLATVPKINEDSSDLSEQKTLTVSEVSAPSAVSTATTANANSVWDVSKRAAGGLDTNEVAKTSQTKGPVTKKKLVIVGDGCSGKSYLVYRWVHRQFLGAWYTTPWDEYTKQFEVDGTTVEFHIFDMAGQEDYDRLRPLAYPADVVLICFGIDTPDALDNVQEKWISEVLHFNRNVPILLIGCQKDLRHDQKVIEELRKTSQKPCRIEEGEEVKKRIGAVKYLECSAYTGEGVDEVFEHAAREAMAYRRTRKKKFRALRRIFRIDELVGFDDR